MHGVGPVPVAAQSKAWGLRPLACWDCRFESCRGHGCLSLVQCLFCRRHCVGLITRPEESYGVCGVSECDCEASIVRIPWPTRGCCATGNEIHGVVSSAISEVTMDSVVLEYYLVRRRKIES
jgi:hypothetical protein